MQKISEKSLVVVNGIKTKVHNLDYDITLLDWIRTSLNLKGTKEGCNEGDCGACSVLILEKKNEKPKAINSCLIRLGQVIGKNIITIEGIGDKNNLNPVQKSFVKNNASQCGFCTPGFIISATTLLYDNKKINDDNIHDTLSGNLCRCTGYTPIINSLKELDNVKLAPPKYIPVKKIEKVTVGSSNYYHPKNLKDLTLLTQKINNFSFLSGGTDLNLEREVYSKTTRNYICLTNIKELNEYKLNKNKLIIGSSVSIEKLLEIIENLLPDIKDILRRFGSPLIRNQATIGGNICTSSPIGDLSPIFLALGTNVTILSHDNEYQMPIEKFFINYRKNTLKKFELVKNFEISLPQKNYKFFSWKFSKRYDQDISTVSIAIKIKLSNQIISDIKIAAGGVAEKPTVFDEFNSFMIGKNYKKGIENALNNVEKFVSPISDLRGTSEYRIGVFKGAFKKLKYSLENNTKPLSIMEIV